MGRGLRVWPRTKSEARPVRASSSSKAIGTDTRAGPTVAIRTDPRVHEDWAWSGRARSETSRPAGGSAMPWGLVLPAVRAKLAEEESEPEVRPRALSNW